MSCNPNEFTLIVFGGRGSEWSKVEKPGNPRDWIGLDSPSFDTDYCRGASKYKRWK